MTASSRTADGASVIVFVKAPIPGLVKTRLTPRFDAVRAAEFYRAMVEDLLERLAALEGVGIDTAIRFAPARESTLMARWLGPRVQMSPQRGRDLGARMAGAFRDAFRNGSQRCVLIGSDVPDLTAAIVSQALAKLSRNDLVIGPSRDGGYYLLALRQPRPELFTDMPWSTHRVFEETMRRARELGIRVARLRRLSDVDTPADVVRLWRRLRGRPEGAATMPRVTAWLRDTYGER